MDNKVLGDVIDEIDLASRGIIDDAAEVSPGRYLCLVHDEEEGYFLLHIARQGIREDVLPGDAFAEALAHHNKENNNA
jgi:hypothetical protein